MLKRLIIYDRMSILRDREKVKRDDLNSLYFLVDSIVYLKCTLLSYYQISTYKFDCLFSYEIPF